MLGFNVIFQGINCILHLCNRLVIVLYNVYIILLFQNYCYILIPQQILTLLLNIEETLLKNNWQDFC